MVVLFMAVPQLGGQREVRYQQTSHITCKPAGTGLHGMGTMDGMLDVMITRTAVFQGQLLLG